MKILVSVDGEVCILDLQFQCLFRVVYTELIDPDT